MTILTTLGPTISTSGISVPTYAQILESMIESSQQIFGSDIYLAPDSQDGQLLAIFAQAISDCNQAAVVAYQSFSPSWAQGVGLSGVVKINGIARQAASNATAIGTVTGVVGTVITAGQVLDTSNNLWNLPATVQIPSGGSVSVTVTAQNAGALVAPAGTINTIANPQVGWQSFVSTANSSGGAAVESDAALRQRQALSVANPAQSTLAALQGALSNLPGVTSVVCYENTTGLVDANGLPAHSISVVIAGGDANQIAYTIGQRKTPGAATYGTTAQKYTDPVTGITYAINFFVLTTVEISVVVTGHALAGYSIAVQTEIQKSIAAYINGLGAGGDVLWSRLWLEAYLNGGADASKFQLTNIVVGVSGGSLGTTDVPISFNRTALCNALTDITVSIS